MRGGIGTLSEVTLAWSLIQTRSQAGKPLVLLGAHWQSVVDAFRRYSDLGGSIAGLARIVHAPEDVLPALRNAGVSEEQIRQMTVANPRRIFEHSGPY